jgi:pyruvate dehydrogenase E1 component alpha subunit
LRTYLTNQGAWTKNDEEALLKECSAKVEEAANAFLASEPEPPTAMFDFAYEKRPDDLDAQRQDAVRAWSAKSA